MRPGTHNWAPEAINIKKKSYDAIVIGSGPGGQKAAIQGAKLGKKIALIEGRGVLGGFCTHTGTIPSKTLKHAADFFKSLNSKINNEFANQEFLQSTFSRMADTISLEQGIAEAQLKRNGVEIFHGFGHFTSPKVVQVDLLNCEEVTLEAEHVIIATGSRPGQPEGLDIFPPFYDSDSILTISKLPESLIVEGGGVIGTEYA